MIEQLIKADNEKMEAIDQMRKENQANIDQMRKQNDANYKSLYEMLQQQINRKQSTELL